MTVTLTTALVTPVGPVSPGANYDLMLTHNGHTHVLPNAALRSFLDEFGVVRYEAVADDDTIGLLPGQVTGATLKP